MKRFVFRLESVLKVRRAEEEKVQREFAAIQARIARKSNEMSGLEREREGVKGHLREIRLDESTRGTVNSLRAYLQRLWIARENASMDMTELDQEMQSKRSDLVEARRQVKALELLEERRLQEWRKEADRQERKVLDDLRIVGDSGGLLKMDMERRANAG